MTNSLFNNIFKGQEIAFRAGQEEERKRILKEAGDWISESLGQCSPNCNCEVAKGLENFIRYSNFKGENK